MARRTSLLLLLAYPVSVHYGVVTNNFWPAVTVLAVIAAILVGTRASGFRYPDALLAAAAVMLGGWRIGDQFDLLIWPPLLIYFGLALVFAMSLLPDREPLVTRFARLLDGEPDAVVRRYTRRVTLAWALFLVLLGVISLLLAGYGSRESWSLFTNLLGYLLILMFFLAEFLLRRHCVPHQARHSFIGFMRAIVQLAPRGQRK